MSDNMVEKFLQNHSSNRRQFLQRAGIAGAAVVGAGAMLGIGQSSAEAAQSASFGAPGHRKHLSQTDILNFALNLEYLEAEYYLRASTGSGLPASMTTGTGTQGTVTGGVQVPFADHFVKGFAAELAREEQGHVAFLRSALGSTAVAEPTIDFTAAFNTLATAAGLITAGQTFNPFANDDTFLLGAFVFEDVGVTAYNGAAPYLNEKYLQYAASILAVEAYHGGVIRATLYQRGIPQPNQTDISSANAIASVRAVVDGHSPNGHDSPLINASGQVQMVPVDSNSLAYYRTFDEVLNIVYAGGASGHYGFFPKKTNGVIS